MTDYPKELWLVCGKYGWVDAEFSETVASERAASFDDLCPGDAPHLIARVTPEWEKPEEQK